MSRWSMIFLPALALLLAVPHPVVSCSLCLGKLQMVPTFRQEAAQPQCRLILFGTLSDPRLTDGVNGVTKLNITQVLRSDPWLGERKFIEIPRWLPVSDPKNPPRMLVFCDVFRNQLDPYRGLTMKSPDAVDYVKKAIALPDKDPAANLQFFFNYLDNTDKELATDAFMEFAKASDQVVGEVATKLPLDRLRALVQDPSTPSERLALYAFLLGAAGGDADADLLEKLLNSGSERISNAQDGILSGLMHRRPREGWDLALSILRDGRKPLQQRLAVVRSVRFYQGWQPEKHRANVLRALDAIILQGELADMAVEDLRKFKIWDRSREVLALYGKKGYDAPIMQRTVLRYALSCPKDNAVVQFLDERRKQEPELVKEVAESLDMERK